MATAELINPALSRSGSSESSLAAGPDTSSRQPKRRTALLRQQLSLDIPDGNRALLSSSLPSPISKKELSFLKAIHHNEKNKRQKFKESKESLSQSMEVAEPVEADSSPPDASKRGALQRSLSTTQGQESSSRMRPRSASLFSTDRNERGSAKRKSLRGLSRSRPSSAKLGRSRSRADSTNPEVANTEKVESIMANIKTQLTQFSEEDQALQERMNKLTEGINLLISSCLRKQCPPLMNPTCTRSVSSGTPRKPGKAVHWKDMETATISDNALSSKSEANLSASCPMPLPTLTLSTSNTEINLLLNDDGEESKVKDDACKHKILKLNGGLESGSLTDSPSPVCTIVIEEPNGHLIRCHSPSEEPDGGLINCHTPSSIADDEVFVL